MSEDKVALCVLKKLEIKLRDDLLSLDVSGQSEPFRVEGPIPTPTDLVKLCATTANCFQEYVETIRDDNISNQTLSQLSKQRKELQSPHRQCEEAIQNFRKLGDSYASTPERQGRQDLVQAVQEFLGGLRVLSDFFDQLNDWLINIESWISEDDFRDEDIAPLKEWLHDEVQAFEAY
ncbi:hypothetical protein QCA50_013608 [Cerrena zonata]|uniref:Uncharacterized protein n=1 Tax=Cerrena zonata TaxID=2478898 RepID=A0AAW0FRE2_9APHY